MVSQLRLNLRILCLLLFTPAVFGAVDIGGYYKNLAVQGRTFIGTNQDYFLDLNRLRLDINASYPFFSLQVKYDNEGLMGSYLRTEQYQRLLQQPSAQYWKLQKRYLKGGDIQLLHRLYRASVAWHGNNTDIRLGRQQINWSTTIIWNPMDNFNPRNPLQLEQEERQGVDAVNIDYALGDVSTFSVAYAPAHSSAYQRYGGRLSTHWQGMDIALMVGNFAHVQKWGLGLAGQWGLVGLRSELVISSPTSFNDPPNLTQAKSKQQVTEWVLSADYTTVSGLHFLLESYWNGEGTTRKSQYDFSRLIQGQLLGVARHYLGGKLSKDWTPLYRTSLYMIENLDDGSRFFYPSISYTVPQFEDLYLKFGAQLFDGSTGSEYQFFKSLYFVEVKQFF